MATYIENFFTLLSHFFQSLGYLGMGVGMLVESCCIPLPSEIILPVAGNLVAAGTCSMLWANVSVAIGGITGSLIAYYIGYAGGRPLVNKIINKYGGYLFISKEHFQIAEKSFNKYGSPTVFIGRLLPGIRTFISLPAGIARMNVFKFIFYSLIGMIPWNILLIWLGYKFGKSYKQVISPFFHKFEYVVVGVTVFVTIFAMYKFLVHYSRMKKERNKLI